MPKTFENKPLDMVQAIRDTLLNYTNVVEQQLAGPKPATNRPRPPRKRPAGASNASQIRRRVNFLRGRPSPWEPPFFVYQEKCS